jgi:hypothetical protein
VKPSKAPTVSMRLADWRRCVADSACKACGAEAGRACAHGGRDVDCAGGCTVVYRCHHGTQVHVVRFHSWLRPCVVTKGGTGLP